MATKEILVVDDEIGIRELLSEILFDELVALDRISLNCVEVYRGFQLTCLVQELQMVVECRDSNFII